MRKIERIKDSAELTKSTNNIKDIYVEDSENTLLYDVDQAYIKLYNEGLVKSKTPDSGEKRKARFYNLVQFLMSTSNLNGDIVECGSWHGLSSYLMCDYLRKSNRNFKGKGYHVVDSFEGLSVPTDDDIIDVDIVLKGKQRKGKAFKNKGAYSADFLSVKNLLGDYPKIQYHVGWIPEVFASITKRDYKFVHIDLDIYEPIRSSLEFFYPLLVPGGIIVCDDYGSRFWPGAQKAVEEFCGENNLNVIALTTGQAILIKNSGYEPKKHMFNGITKLFSK